MKKIGMVALVALMSLVSMVANAQTVDVPFILARNYFVNNNVEQVPAKITSQAEFDKYLSPAAFMGEDGEPTQIDFQKQFVIVISPATTDTETDILPLSLMSREGKLRFRYNIRRGEKLSYSMRPLLLMVVDKAYDGTLSCEEEGSNDGCDASDGHCDKAKACCAKAGDAVSPSTLIIGYDAAVGKKPLMKAVKARKAKVIYDYKNFNSIAIRIAKGDDIQQAQEDLQKVKGVLSVERDRIMKLD